MNEHTLLIVDGYNVIGAWPEAVKNAWPLAESRDRLTHLLYDYAGYTGEKVVLVFDGYKGQRLARSEETSRNVTVVYTKQNETADSYIERLAATTPKYMTVQVVTSDALEQTMVLGQGATRVSSRELLSDIRRLRAREYALYSAPHQSQRNTLWHYLTPAQQEALEKIRRSKE